jgi:outer membrane protein assembly factor BamB
VTAGGRLFFLVDEAPPANINLPGKWTLVARDAFSGVTLWKKPLESWAWHRIGFRSGPPQLTRLLVASNDRLYSPLELNGPICQIDAATGETLKTFEATAGAEELVVVDGLLIVLKGSPVAEQAFQDAAFKDQYRFPNEKQIVAIDATSGKALWQWSDPEMSPMPETLAADARRVYVQVNEGVACLDVASGKAAWIFGDATVKANRKKLSFGVNTLVVADDVVLSKLSGRLTALSAERGEKLWDCDAGGGFHAPLDVFVIDGLVWQGLHTSDSVAPAPVHDFAEGRDLHTGEVKATNDVAVDLQTAGHHHRCYREKATDRFILTGKRGIELIDLEGNQQSRNNWIRGTCQYGIMPANGLIYVPPHSCGCYMESKLRGFWAMAADSPQAAEIRRPVPDDKRLETGPAFGETRTPPAESAADWPTYGHDPLRSGVATTAIPGKLTPTWQTAIGGRLTQPVAAEGKVVISRVDENTVMALDQRTGSVLWRRAVGGRVDSPPTIHRGTVLFGSADGWVYCLRLSDGQIVWRFLAAPTELNAVAFDRLESLWPVHGSVLVLDGVAYCSAGRSTWIDGGIDLYGLDPATGKVVSRNHYESRHPEYREGKPDALQAHESQIDQNKTDYKTFLQPDLSDSFSMAGGTVSDVLVSDGANVFLHQAKFTPRLEKRDDFSRHLFSTSSLLDDAENHRSHWVLGSGDFSRVGVAYSWVVDRPGSRMPTIAVPTGVMMVFDEEAVWGVRRQGNSDGRYSLFKMENRPFSPGEAAPPDFRAIPKEQVQPNVWQIDLPVRMTAMLKSGDNLLLGVAPVEIPLDDPYAAYEGRMGGSLWVCSEGDGAKLAELPLASPVVWGGMAAADGRLFAATAAGSLLCFE